MPNSKLSKLQFFGFFVCFSLFCYFCIVFLSRSLSAPFNLIFVMPAWLTTILLLVVSNTFMTFAWYGHLKLQATGATRHWPLIGVILLSWGIAFFEYCFMVPANRIGYVGNGGPMNLMQLKVLQKVITLTVFTVIATFFLGGERLQWNHIAAFICLIAAVYFVFMPGSK